MNRKELAQFIEERYGAQEEHLWERTPEDAIFRHGDNNKWFAVLLTVRRDRLGLAGEGTVDIVDVKCDPMELGSLLEENGIIPAYHMNKENWIAALLDGTADDETVKRLVETSFELTAKKC